MKNLLTLLVVLLFVTSCGEKSSTIHEQLLSGTNGWRIQQYSVYDGDLNDPSNSNITNHYKNIGILFFSDDGIGNYEYDSLSYPFTWSVVDLGQKENTSILIDIPYESITDHALTSPFLYFAMAGPEGSPLYNDPDQVIKYYDIYSLSSHTLHFVYDPKWIVTTQNFGALEFIVTKE